MRMLTVAVTFTVLMMLASTASAQQLDLRSLDKFAEKASSKTELNMDESMLKSAAGLLDPKKGDEAIAKKSTENLKGFYLRAYEFDQPGVFKLDDLKPILDQLKGPAWTLFMRNKEDGEQTEIWMHRTNGEPDGMLLVAAEEEEVVVINTIGVTSLEAVTRLGDQFTALPATVPTPKPAEK